MARPQSNGDGTDTIDLTLSSPEPESLPKEQMHAPSQPQSYSGWPHSASRVKQESGHLPRIKPESVQPSRVQKNTSKLATSSRATSGPQQTRQIHTSHLHAIISTTSPHVLRKVLLELCQVSPALSGALVRGLAPYSASAQNIMSQHRMYPQQSDTSARDDDESDVSYETWRPMIGASPYSSQGNRFPGQRLGGQTSQPRQHTHAFQSTPQAGRDPFGPSTPTSDSELRRPGPSAQKAMRPNAIRTPLQNLPRGSSTTNSTPDTYTVARPLLSPKKITAKTTKTCIKCDEPFFNDSEPCIYHPGEAIEQENGKMVWSCCDEDMLSVGCDFGGRHIDESDGFEDSPIHNITA